MAKFFIERPVFAWVIAIVIMLSGIFALNTLPISQYPNVAPPTISISANYPGADAETLENSVTQIIEQALTGIDGMLYFSSSSSSDGSVKINITFDQSIDPDTAQVQVQNKTQQAMTRLPAEVQAQGVNIRKSQSNFLMIIALYDSLDNKKTSDLADYLVSNIQDPLSRINGVGDIRVFGASYAMRIWLDPAKLASYNLNPTDVENAIRAQNTEISAGKIGAQPSVVGQEITATVKAQSKLKTPEEFRNIILKSNFNGATVLMKDVARVEMGEENYSIAPKLNGHAASGIAVMLAPGANALETSEAVKNMVSQFEPSLPEGYKVAYARDSTAFIKISIEEVVKTLAEAIFLVILVMFLFLQNVRATLIPAITVPIVILGTFGVLALFGYSINTLTLFALVLSIGLLVDDSIVVVENVERVMKEEGLNAKEATVKSMKEISSALIGIATVLSAVFLPMAFFGGSSGIIYRQFSITIVSSMFLSVVVALILTPALCASFLKPVEHKTTGFFGWFNRTYDNFQTNYKSKVHGIAKKPFRFMFVYALIVAGMVFLFNKLPSSFLPMEDQGDVMLQYTLPAGATIERTEVVGKEVQKYFLETESKNTKYIFTISGFNFSGSGQNAGMAFISLNDWKDRVGVENSASSIANKAMMTLSSIKDAKIFALTPPAISELGQSSGFSLNLQAVAGTSREQLKEYRDIVIQKANKSPLLSSVRSNELQETPQLKIEIDHKKAASLGVSMADINSTLSTAWGGSYVNDFIDRGRVKKVYVQSDMQFRSNPEDLNGWFVRSSNGTMTPFSSFATFKWSFGPDSLGRYNGLSSYEIQGAPAAGVSSGVAMAEMEKIVSELPGGTIYSWSGLSYQEKISQGKTGVLYAISVLVVFLCLAALYESWSIPLSVILVIPLGIIGAVCAALFRGLENDIYFQVALLTTIGLSAKNAILIVEFAEMYYKSGKGIIESAVAGAGARLRPILMTSLAFIAGVLPLAISSGAGANSRISIGTGIIGGTLTATVLAIFFVPIFFVIVRYIFNKKNKQVNHV